MSVIDVSQIAGFDGMTAEQKIEALLKLEIPDKVDLSQYVSKADHDKIAGELEQLRKADGGNGDLAKQLEALQKNYDALQRESEIAKTKARYLAMPGYNDDLATKAATAIVDKDTEKLFDIQAKANDAYKKQLEADSLKKMKPPVDGDPPEEENEALALAKKLGKSAAENLKSSKTLEHYM